MSASEILLTELNQGVLTITLNRPKVNAFNFEMIAAAQAAFKAAASDPQTRCVLLTGSGSAFSAGQDVSEFRQGGEVPIRYHLLRTYNPLILQIRRLEKPVLAAINGVVSGAALGIALACDLRMAADTASFVVGFLGMSEFTFSNAPIDAGQALAWGLVNRVAPAAELASQARDWARQLAHGPVGAMGLAKRDFNKAVLGNLEGVLDYEAHIQEIAGKGREHQEGVAAFLEKRSPEFN